MPETAFENLAYTYRYFYSRYMFLGFMDYLGG